MIKNCTITLLAGGFGTRLWPISRKSLPKQFLCLLNKNKSIFRETLERISSISKNISIIGNRIHKDIINKESDFLSNSHNLSFLFEPENKNTMPSCIISCLFAIKKITEDAIVIILPCDSFIENLDLFKDSLETGYKIAKEKNLFVTLGVNPSFPSTEYGYIGGDNLLEENVFLVERFIEKPNKESAIEYIKSGFLWNSGIFILPAKKFIEESFKINPKMVDLCKKSIENYNSNEIFLNDQYFQEIESKSIDYGFMEKTKNLAMVKSFFTWNDLGNFNELYKISEKDENQNVKNGKIIDLDVKNCYINNQNNEQTIALNGVENLSICSTKDVILIANKENITQRTEKLSNEIKKYDQNFIKEKYSEERNWGRFFNLHREKNYKIKKVIIEKGGKLSLQTHQKRSEYWTLIEGSGELFIENQTKIVKKGDIVSIPIGAKHTIKNIEETPLIFIEVQLGEYLEEDDIQRYPF